MEKQNKTIRLVYPQWQGGNIAQWITEVKDAELASRGYYLGAQLLNFLAPSNGQATFTVPIATDIVKREVTDGVLDKEALILQTKAALDILKVQNPQKIVALGGECSASVVPFTLYIIFFLLLLHKVTTSGCGIRPIFHSSYRQ